MCMRHESMYQCLKILSAQLSINTIRTLSIDAIDRANSGHPGTAMALAPLGL